MLNRYANSEQGVLGGISVQHSSYPAFSQVPAFFSARRSTPDAFISASRRIAPA